VVDDGSSDASMEIARAFEPRVRCYRTQTPGRLGAAHDHGLSVARGELIAFLDHDDLWEPAKLEHQVAALTRSPEIDLVFGQVIQFPSPELPAETAARLRYRSGPLPATVQGTMLAHRKALERVGPFATDLLMGDFMDWLLRAREEGLRTMMLDQVVLRRRLHDASHTVRNRERIGQYAEVLKRSLDRRREADP